MKKIEQTKDSIKTLIDRLKSIKILLKTVRSIVEFTGFKTSCSVELAFDTYRNLLMKQITHRGLRDTARLFKLYLTVGQRIAVGAPYDPVPWRKVIPGTTIPKDLKPLLPLLQGSAMEKRLGLTILMIVRLIHLPPILDLESITRPGAEIGAFTKQFIDFVKTDKLFSQGLYKPTLGKYDVIGGHLSSKNGPNGPAVRNSHWDTLALFHGPKILRDSVTSLLKVSNRTMYLSVMSIFVTLTKEPLTTKRIPILSKISMISEGGGKTRNIAILDFWSQNGLKWIHDLVMDILKNMRTDSTYNQEDGFKKVILRANQTNYCASFDLSSATDRFPLSLQHEVMILLIGKELADHWKTVISDRDFQTPTGQSVRWKVGQPMGALSSWGVFALTHHLIVLYAAKDLSFKDYMILGDDLVILNREVAGAYKEIMNEIGVTINQSKSFVSQDSKEVYGEFAKRIFLGPNEITGLPPDLLWRSYQTLYMIPPLLDFLKRRWNIQIPGFELYTPELFTFLTKKGQFHLSIILGFELAKEALTGYPWCQLGMTAENLIKAYNSDSIHHMLEKIEWAGFNGQKKWEERIKGTLNDLAIQEDDTVSNRVHNWIKRKYHPLSIAMTSALRRLAVAQGPMFIILDSYVSKIPVDHIPDCTLGSMFVDRKTDRHRNHGAIVIGMYYKRLGHNKQKN